MNERIKQLYEQAMEQHVSNNMAWEELNPEKFAELIVRECCEVINAAKPGVVQVPAEVALDMTAKNVKAYFGVE